MIYQYGDKIPKLLGDEVFVAASADVIGSVVLGENTSVWFGAVIRGDCDLITVGARSNIQDNAVLHTDPGVQLTIGEDVTVGHLAMLHGCTIGDGSLIGIGAVVLNGAKIGRNCLIGAQCFVPEGKEIPDNSLVVGSPAKVIRTLDESVAVQLIEAAAHYVEKGRQYLTDLKPL